MRIESYDVEPLGIELTASRVKEVKFQFQGLSFNVRPEAMLYTWRLQGVDEAWRAPSTQGEADYRNLDPGRYTFEVRAIDRDLNFSRASAVVPLLIELPWYLNRVYAIPLGLVGLSFCFALVWTVQQAVVHRRAARSGCASSCASRRSARRRRWPGRTRSWRPRIASSS